MAPKTVSAHDVARTALENVVNTLPLHPAVVHVPLGLAVVMPLLLGAMLWAIATGRLPAKAWILVLVLQGVLVGAAAMALWTGGQDEERVEARAGEAAVESHERSAQAFTVAAGATLIAAAGALILRHRRRPFLGAGLASTVLSIGMLVLGVQAGGRGGALVHGGSTMAQGNANQPVDPGPAPDQGPRGERDQDEDDDD
jgi:uncharacterized membrane protein